MAVDESAIRPTREAQLLGTVDTPARLHGYWLGSIPFDRAEAAQDAALDALRQGAPHSLLLLELQSTITSGRRGSWDDLLVDATELDAKGVARCDATRGGKLTYHGPGQLVVYANLALDQIGRGGPDLVRWLADGACEWLRGRGHTARWSDDEPGVWVDWTGGAERKLGSVGLRVSRGLSRHGLSINLDVPGEVFTWFRPCGMQGEQLGSLAQIEPGPPVSAHRAALQIWAILAHRWRSGWPRPTPDTPAGAPADPNAASTAN